MQTDNISQLAGFLRGELADLIDVRETVIGPRRISFLGKLLVSPDLAIPAMEGRLAGHGYIPLIRSFNGGVEVRIVSKPRAAGKKPNIGVNIALLAATVLTTLVAGASLAHGGGFLSGLFLIISRPALILEGIPFSFTLLSILVIHELGHYFASMYHGVRSTLPYFIPAPTFLGTLGAVIKTRSVIPDRKSLIDIGASGPIAGFVIAVPAFIIGVRLSEFGYMPHSGGLQFGDSIVVKALIYVFKGAGPEGAELFLHPVAFAAWIGLFITMLNLLPAGQLDGGHICYALFGRGHFYLARGTVAVLVVLSLYNREAGMIWMVWAILIMIIGLDHGPPVNDITPLGTGRKVLGAVAIAIFVLCFVPVPFRW
ncbi:MAG: site-2 protease family protein [Candidatus Tritonobacter lacicola]|nr:site-2 protease family protein [Candidatus Tritonobacter lacicola]